MQWAELVVEEAEECMPLFVPDHAPLPVLST
jgi:hypothetical protein